MSRNTIITEELASSVKALASEGLAVPQIARQLQIPRSAVDRAMNGVVNTPKKCDWCGEIFISARLSQCFCTESCRMASNQARIRRSTTRKPPRRKSLCKMCGVAILSGYNYCYDCDGKREIRVIDFDDMIEKEKPSNHPAISQLAREAKKLGMTYGEYVRFKETKK